MTHTSSATPDIKPTSGILPRVHSSKFIQANRPITACHVSCPHTYTDAPIEEQFPSGIDSSRGAMEYHHGRRLSVDPMLEEALIHVEKCKSAEKTVQTTRKELIGCEKHSMIEKSDDIQLQRAVLQLQNTMLEAHDILDKGTDQETEMSSLCSSNEFLCTASSEDKSPSSTGEAAISTINDLMVGCLEIEVNSDVEDGTHQEPICTPINKTAVMRLFEICATCNWNTPEFVLRKVDGPIHKRRFTYKVIVEVENITYTKLECFSEPRTEKIAAREHAAEGALWFLKHLGHT